MSPVAVGAKVGPWWRYALIFFFLFMDSSFSASEPCAKDVFVKKLNILTSYSSAKSVDAATLVVSPLDILQESGSVSSQSSSLIFIYKSLCPPACLFYSCNHIQFNGQKRSDQLNTLETDSGVTSSGERE